MSEERYQYGVRVLRSTPREISRLSVQLGFIVQEPGGFQGRPQNGALLDYLAEAIRRDLGAVVNLFKQMDIENK